MFFQKMFKVRPSINLMDLTPNTNYTIEVTAVPINSESNPIGFCSEPTTITAKTSADGKFDVIPDCFCASSLLRVISLQLVKP